MTAAPVHAPQPTGTTAREATALVVAYGLEHIDVSWLPESTQLVVVHNDRSLRAESIAHPNTKHLYMDHNVGFGAAVNRGLAQVETQRVVLVNPDVMLSAQHWTELACGGDDEITTVNLRDARGHLTVTVCPYPTPLAAVANGWRLGRFAPRGTRRRAVLSRLGGAHERAHHDSLSYPSGRWPLRQRWVSGAVLSVPAACLRAVGGFDESYFLYVEDLDLCERMAARFGDLSVRLADLPPALHSVGGTSTPASISTVERHRLASWCLYASRKRGGRWRLARVLLRLRKNLLHA